MVDEFTDDMISDGLCITADCEYEARVSGYCMGHYAVARQKAGPVKEEEEVKGMGEETKEEKSGGEQDPICGYCGKAASAVKTPFSKKQGKHQSCVQKEKRAAKRKPEKADKTAVKKAKTPIRPDSLIGAKDRDDSAGGKTAHGPAGGEDIRRIFDMATEKYAKGEKKYGPLDIDTDPRNFIYEAKDELLDGMVYLAFQIKKLEKIEAAANVFLRGMESLCTAQAKGG